MQLRKRIQLRNDHFSGLQGILEKDFVLMRGLKHDLNRKLREMESNRGAVSVFHIHLQLLLTER